MQFFSKHRCVILLAVVSLLVPECTTAVNTPEQPIYNFGEVKQGEKITHEFFIKNPLSVPLKVARIDLSAPGMTARVQPFIDPGSTGRFEIVWNTEKIASSVTGRATVHFFGDFPEVTLTLSGKVIPDIEAIPLAGFYVTMFAGESAESSITLINHRDRPLNIQKADSASSLFQAILDTPNPGQVYKLSIKVFPGISPGRYADSIRLQTNDASNPLIQVPVNILVKDVLYASQNVVDFGGIDIAYLLGHADVVETLSHTIILRKRTGEFAIKSIATDIRGLRVTYAPKSPSQSFDIQVGLDLDKLRPGDLTGTIRIFATDPTLPEVAIAVKGRLQ